MLKYLAILSLKIKIFSSKLSFAVVMFDTLTHYLIEMPFNNFANRADPDQAALELPDQGLLCLLMEI